MSDENPPPNGRPQRTVRIGGVHEPFNLPWITAAAGGRFDDLDISVEFIDYDGGTGALVTALEDGELDLATVLTEGGVTAAANGRAVRLHSAFTESPLTWGIHVAASADIESLDDFDDLGEVRFAISRPGSGSELMAHVLAEDLGIDLAHDQLVVVGGVDGALDALSRGAADLFLWERFVTAQHVRSGVFRRIGDLPTPWPAFHLAARPALLAKDRDLVDRLAARALDEAARLLAEPAATAVEIIERYGMNDEDCQGWLEQVAWPPSPRVDAKVLERAMQTMASVGRIDAPVPVDDLV